MINFVVMKSICYIIAMQAEGQPLIDKYSLSEVEDAFAPLPCRLFQGKVNGSIFSLVLCGQQHGSDLIGCEIASVATQIAIERIHPDLIINAGTCGAFKSKGAEIGKVYIGSGAMFHDRRVGGDNEWCTQGLGNYSVWEKSAELARSLGLPLGKVTTGSSLDMQPCDLQIITENGGELKDMEGAAVAFVCSLHNIPVLLVKSVTDLCDGGAVTLDEFLQNLHSSCLALRRANDRIIDYIL